MLGTGAYYYGLPGLFLGLAGLSLILVIGLVWQSLSELESDAKLDFEEALTLARPTVAEEQKRAVLRTLKDLDYELSLGKISRDDYDTLSRLYREKARAFIEQSDESLRLGRAQAELLIQKALEAAPEPPSENRDISPSSDKNLATQPAASSEETL